jgi:hypothetical protein
MLRDLVDGPAKNVWVRQGLPPDDIENLWLTEAPDPSVNSNFKLGTAAQVSCAHTFSGIGIYVLGYFSNKLGTTPSFTPPQFCLTLNVISWLRRTNL